MERHRRFMLWLIALALILPLLLKGHGAPDNQEHVAFLPYTARGLTVRLAGMVKAPGVYKFPDRMRVSSVIKMAAISPWFLSQEKWGDERELHNGDILEVVDGSLQHPDIIIKKMRAPERMTLGIPLDPNRMEQDDWDNLPGIGPKLAERIVKDRQIHGGYRTIEDLLRVPGIGKGRLAKIKKYF